MPVAFARQVARRFCNPESDNTDESGKQTNRARAARFGAHVAPRANRNQNQGAAPGVRSSPRNSWLTPGGCSGKLHSALQGGLTKVSKTRHRRLTNPRPGGVCVSGCEGAVGLRLDSAARRSDYVARAGLGSPRGTPCRTGVPGSEIVLRRRSWPRPRVLGDLS